MTISATTTPATTAEPEPGLREQKRRATREALVGATLALAAEHGFSHVTVEQICERAGVSRRTFFNYFPTKEDALLGRDGQGLPDDLVTAFLAAHDPTAGGPTGPSGLSATLVDDLVELVAGVGSRLPARREAFADMQRAIDKDPRLLVIMRDAGQRSIAELADLVARREGVAVDDPRVQVTTQLVAVLGHHSMLAYFEGEPTRSFRAVLLDTVAAARAVLAP